MKMFKILALILILGIIVTNLSAQQGQMDWYQVTPSAGWSGRHNHTSVVFNNTIWVLGGYANYSIRQRDVWYSVDGRNWSCATPSAGWSARASHASVVFDKKMRGANANLQIWDGCNDTETKVSPVSFCRFVTQRFWTQRVISIIQHDYNIQKIKEIPKFTIDKSIF